jgi:hypothetical protein
MKIARTSVALAAATFASLNISLPAQAATTPYRFANCDAMHRFFAHGVGQIGAKDKTSGTPVTSFARAPKWYARNTASDRDKHGIACEAA